MKKILKKLASTNFEKIDTLKIIDENEIVARN